VSLKDSTPSAASSVWLSITMALITAGAASGQGRVHATPSVSTAEAYDSNVFATPTAPQADFVTRASVGLDVDYTAPRVTASALYLQDAERFADRPRLSSVDARQRATLAFGYQATPRTRWIADGGFWKTRTPGELNESTGLTFSRASARRLSAHTSLNRRFDQLTSGTVDYTLTQDHLAGRTAAATHDVSLGVERRRSSRTTLSVDYRFRAFAFTNPAQEPLATTSQAMTLGWTRTMTSRWRLAVDGGPRLTNGSVMPEVSTSIHYQATSRDISLTYARTQSTVIGFTNVVETQSVGAAMTSRLWSSLHVRLSPSLFRTDLGGVHADAWLISLDLTHPLGHGLALDFAADASMQRGGLNPSLSNATIARRVVLARLIAGSLLPLR